MYLNFYLEGAGIILCIVLWVTCTVRYSTFDLKDKIYIRMLKLIILGMVLNLIGCQIIRNSFDELTIVAELCISFSFLLMVHVWIYFNTYLIEVIYNRNGITVQSNMLLLLPSLMQLIALIVNCGYHYLFDVEIVDGRVQLIFNEWYKLPYVLAAVSLCIYLVLLLKNTKCLREKGQYIFYVIPPLMFLAYYLQYRYKSIAILGFSYALVLLLVYLYSYDFNIKTDALTRLPNGDSFRRMLDYRLSLQQPMTVALITLNDFKQVNQEYGYHNGNKFIAKIAQYLKNACPKKSLARYGGDVFGVILQDTSEEKVIEWAKCILTRFEENWQVGKRVHRVSVCITIATCKDMTESSEQLLELLNYVNGKGKKQKKNQYLICEEADKQQLQRKMRIVSTLKEIIEDGKMYVNYQPILDVQKNVFSRGEALFRLEDGVLGDIPPYEFFPIAEENGYVIEIGYVLIEKVCQYIQGFIEDGAKPPIISVNFDRQQLMADDVEERILQILARYELTPEHIAIELPESVFAIRYPEVRTKIMHMAEQGFHFYLDGFGSGLLDLSHVMELPFDIIKINKKMIHEAENDEAIYLLVSAMAAVFEENGKQILGDGIESKDLKELCDLLFMNYLQGYYFGEPMSEEQAKEEFAKVDIVANMSEEEQAILNTLLEEVDDWK